MDPDIVEEANAPSLNPLMGSRRNSYSTGDNIEQHCRRARLVQVINDTLESECPSNAQDVVECEQDKVFSGLAKRMGPCHHRHKGSWRKKGKEQYTVFDGGNFVLKSTEKRGGIVSGSGPFQHDVPWRDRGLGRLGHSGCIAPHISAMNRTSSEGIGDIVDGETCSSFTNVSNMGRIKVVDSPMVSRHKTGRRHQRWSNCNFLPKNTGSRRLVQNGGTSHYNMTENKNAAKDYCYGTMTLGDLSDGISSHQHIVSPASKGRHPSKKKGKMTVEDNILWGGQNIVSEISADRLYSVGGNDNAFISSEDIAWRRHDHTSKAPVLPSEDGLSRMEQGISVHLFHLRPQNGLEGENYFNLVDDSPERLTPGSMQAPYDMKNEISSRNQRRQKFWKGKRKCNSMYSNYGGSSTSNFENSDSSYLQSSRHVSYARSTNIDSQYRSENFDSVGEVDGLQSPEERFNHLQGQTIKVPDQSNARASQIESDEILARQLQEQFYDEVSGSASTEAKDATVAWSLQQEDSQLTAASARSLLDNQEESMAHLYAYYAQLPYRNSSTRRSNRAQSLTLNERRNLYGPEIELETKMMADVRNFSRMDSGMRRNFLEALEAAFDQSNDALAETHHDFNENDHHAGASEGQINSLPQSVIQSDNVEEACAICLENPSYGDIIRHLPCLHKFHKECIDAWLRRKIWCPICKSEIT